MRDKLNIESIRKLKDALKAAKKSKPIIVVTYQSPNMGLEWPEKEIGTYVRHDERVLEIVCPKNRKQAILWGNVYAAKVLDNQDIVDVIGRFDSFLRQEKRALMEKNHGIEFFLAEVFREKE